MAIRDLAMKNNKDKLKELSSINKVGLGSATKRCLKRHCDIQNTPFMVDDVFQTNPHIGIAFSTLRSRQKERKTLYLCIIYKG